MDFVKTQNIGTSRLNKQLEVMTLSFALVVTNQGVTRHAITKSGVMLDGVWLDDAELSTSINDIQRNTSQRIDLCMDIIPTNVLVNNDKYLVWYVEPKQRDIWFTNSDVGCIGKVPHPKLIFVTSKINNTINLSVVKSEINRPDNSTELFHAPLANIYKSGDLCIGSAKMPDEICIKSIDEIEAVLFESNYSGYKFDSFTPTITDIEAPLLTDGLLSISTTSCFPDDWLISKNQTLGDLLSSL
ncbi:hypothetical protein EIJ81_00645 (plasmid) [Aliivibrio salmonicida]|uniref:hypothetical protein n=1 Tax=Aliivibrio salmonicida TaxID=40269 RepID=UPI000F6FEBC5|nr:hypothetical protein [Aliivibrio salmonicida]AZL83407.1 hypothetical protein EIJ81_00645 [Aliivibrio salmonicida]